MYDSDLKLEKLFVSSVSCKQKRSTSHDVQFANKRLFITNESVKRIHYLMGYFVCRLNLNHSMNHS